MKIEINISKITDSPYSSELRDSFLIEDNEPVNRLVRELSIAHPSTFLVSGYRGAGKTSFINQVIEAIGNDTVHVNLSLAKFDGYSTLVKKLIRQLHLSFENSGRKDENELKEVREKLKLLYDRTFHDVVHTQKNSLKNETSTSSEISFDLKKLVPVLFVGASGSIAAFDLLKHEFASYGLFLVSLIWASISSWQLKRKTISSDSDIDESSRKTLYDDEIAEHHLFHILKELKQLGVNVSSPENSTTLN
ncbi:MAG: P-loop NTPase fold protein [Cyclobacteriaceae bacterium]